MPRRKSVNFKGGQRGKYATRYAAGVNFPQEARFGRFYKFMMWACCDANPAVIAEWHVQDNGYLFECVNCWAVFNTSKADVP